MTKLYMYRTEDMVSLTSEVINQTRHCTNRETETAPAPLRSQRLVTMPHTFFGFSVPKVERAVRCASVSAGRRVI